MSGWKAEDVQKRGKYVSCSHGKERIVWRRRISIGRILKSDSRRRVTRRRVREGRLMLVNGNDVQIIGSTKIMEINPAAAA